MSALSQYIELYEEHRKLLDKGCGSWMNKKREQAFLSLKDNPLPRKGSENYEKIDLEAILSPNFGLNIARVPLDVNPNDTFRCDVPNLSTNLFMLLNDGYAETDRSRNLLPEGVTVGSLRKMSVENADIFKKYYGNIANMTNPLVALNTMLAQDGFYLHISKGTRLERPLQLVDIFQYAEPLMSARRMLIIVEDDADAKLLLCDHTQNREKQFLNLQTIEIHVGKNASFDFYDLEESTNLTDRISTLYLEQEENSNVMISGLTLYNGRTRNEYYCKFLGEHSEVSLCGLGIEDENRILDNYTRISHDFPNCKSNELFKYVIDDESTGAFSGLIFVADGAIKTEAFQSNRNLVGSEKAEMFSKPQLEIYNDDVKCSHGSATGQLDELQLFYMQTRGIPEVNAKLLLKQAFMADVVDSVRIPVLKDRIRQLVERRFAGDSLSCVNCYSDCGKVKE